MEKTILIKILTGVAVSLMMGLLYKASKGKAKADEQGNLVLKLPMFYWLLGAFCMLIGFALLVVANFYVDTLDDKEIVLYMSLVFCLLGYFLFAKGFISKIIVSERGLLEIGLFGQKTQIDWIEISNVSYGSVSQELKIQSANKKIKAHFHLVGFDELVAKLQEKTNRTPQEMGIK